MRWLLALALVGCVDSDLVECADGRLCPRGTACDVVHKSCVAPDQLTACADLANFTSCTATGVEMGRCFDGVCLPAGCGNGQREPEELCDDGNTHGGDGCSADCVSRELCGDGYTDKLRGEECDDGNTRSRDGCTNACSVERPVWHQHLQDKPAPRRDAAAAYDPLSRNITMFGGLTQSDQIIDDTWGLGEVGWSALFIGTPVRRQNAAMTYDPHRHRIVMFGGFSASAQGVLLNDTWEWNGAIWSRRTSPTVPAGRTRAAMASDGTRVILFGGTQLSDLLDDTWAWDGDGWTRLSPAHSPVPRERHAMVYDPKHGRIVLFGGTIPTAVNDTWSFDGTDWTQVTTTGSPPGLSWVGLAYDAAREVVVLSGVDATTSANVTWELDGATWTNKFPDITPLSAGGAVIAYDEGRQRVVQTGGPKLGSGEMRNEVWEWDGTDWSQRADRPLPPPRQQCALASDPVRGRVVLFGGQGAAIPLGDTWEWDGRGWQQSTVVGPPLRTAASMTYDGNEVLLFGGAGATIYRDTWHWNGQRWLLLAMTGPAPRFGSGMTYDTKRGRVVLFGGSDGTNYFRDTWQWDGTSWSELTVTSAVPARSFTQLVYDPTRDRIVMYGGMAADGVTKLTDTWEFDGTAWTQPPSPTRPEERLGFGLVFDRMRERVMLFGGLVASFSLWEWDGAQWTQPETTFVPLAANNGCVAYDDARSEVITFGGSFVGLLQLTATGSYRGDSDEVCRSGVDLDGDSAVGCADDDCRMICAPLCWDDAACTKAPRCGDGACSTLEDEAGLACTTDCP